ncbi:hypothetical protein [Mycolicibacterium moriokaense]|uniref:DoxX family protein n=1 Tax=Mycolicibacterium moriokaense TaxID=39691 RepID=A0A318HD59_9MYCO|nr:hypothetical protein [Mycolicibacterium moriokaense]PXX06290.1 hypothetical protein C8E89_11463 [Mycolicibacterium moriokaense]
MTERSAKQSVDWNQVFRWAATLFAVAVTLHAVDHLRRGMDSLPPAVMIAGMAQLVLAAVTVALVMLRNRWAPHAAIIIGFVSAIGFTVAHLPPTWGFFSDSFINAPPSAHVTWFSWVTALSEIVADILFGLAGIAVLTSRGLLSAQHRHPK